ncbi:PREDICTED: paramyosin [Dinoponera quadriceps]|uniref:Cilia- and flagella-associated protein 157 n=1 Tax=Dinoponera quadriceps TaxID=609295 RepID=A0A6P3XI13_DINQU|nr:PREDICTED: paramyosin [Dinoponera quadriceps]
MLKKKKRGTEKVRKKCLNERETISYEQQIQDCNRQLSRLRSRNEELENEVKAIAKKFDQLKEDRSDVVAHLKRNLEERTEEARELNERLSALEELRKQEQEEFKEKENAMRLEYRTMENTLSAEVKLAAGKLNALEDWRLARLDLMNKFETQEERIAKQEETHKTALYESEKSVTITKAKMQKEMEERLRQLAQDFKKATDIRVADMMHNAVRRNIALNRELNTMIRTCQELETQSAECRSNDRMLRLQCELFEAEARIALGDAMRQKRAMHELAREHIDLFFEYGQLHRENARFSNYQRLMNEYKAVCATSERKVKDLELRLQEVKEAREHVLAEVREKCAEFDRLNVTLNEAKQCVLQALQLQKQDVCTSDVCTSDVCTSCCADQKQKIIHSLQDILEKSSISDIEYDDSQEDVDVE